MRGYTMQSRILTTLGLSCTLLIGDAVARELRVCAEPNDLPYSHRDETGFENRLARLVARELGATLSYTWHPQWRGFVRKTLGANRCDLLIGVPHNWHALLTTQPYYRSSYVFVTRADAEPVEDIGDARLQRERVGLLLIANDPSATPPGLLLTQGRGVLPNLVGFPVYGEQPAAQTIVQALADGDIDVGIVWGPQAGYHIKQAAVPLKLALAKQPPAASGVQFEYAIAMGVRRTDQALRDELDRVIDRLRPEIDRLLAEYAVPRTDR
jgi:mxaJ protein